MESDLIRCYLLNKKLLLILNCTDVFICNIGDDYIVGKRTIKEFKEWMFKNCKELYDKKYKKPNLSKKQLKNKKSYKTPKKMLPGCW